MNTTTLKDFYAGDLINFNINSSNYDNTYECKVVFVGNKNYNFTSIYNNGFDFEILPELSQLFDKGFYKVFAVFSKEGFQKTEQVTSINVFDNILNTNCVDIISYNRKMLTAIENILANRMEDDYDSYTIGNRSITKMKPESLLKLRDYFSEKVSLEDNYQNGENKGNKMKIRWIGRFGS